MAPMLGTAAALASCGEAASSAMPSASAATSRKALLAKRSAGARKEGASLPFDGKGHSFPSKRLSARAKAFLRSVPSRAGHRVLRAVPVLPPSRPQRVPMHARCRSMATPFMADGGICAMPCIHHSQGGQRPDGVRPSAGTAASSADGAGSFSASARFPARIQPAADADPAPASRRRAGSIGARARRGASARGRACADGSRTDGSLWITAWPRSAR